MCVKAQQTPAGAVCASTHVYTNYLALAALVTSISFHEYKIVVIIVTNGSLLIVFSLSLPSVNFAHSYFDENRSKHK